MKNDNKNSLIKKADSFLKFEPKKKKDLIIRGLKEIDIGKELSQLKDAEYYFNQGFEYLNSEKYQKAAVLLVDDIIHIHRLYDDEEFNDAFGNKIKLVHFNSTTAAFDYLISNKLDFGHFMFKVGMASTM